MLIRKIEKDIHHWIQGSDKALLIYGARQVGKTYIIRKCLRDAGCDYVEFNLIQQPELVDILANATSTDDLFLKLSLYHDKKLIPGKTMIFFDEIQKYKEIVTKVKFLVEDNRCRYILSGSLLGVELVNLKSAPVGYLQILQMYPMDFAEFLQLFHVDDVLMKQLRHSFRTKTPVDEIVHRKLTEIYNLYLIIGGMPAAVDKYRETSDIDEVMDEHRAIIDLYKMDFTQYEEETRKLILTRIYEMIPAELNEQNKRFMIADIHKNLRYERVSDSFTWLLKAGVALGVFNVTEPKIPLLLNEKSSLLKLFLSDVGLLTTLYGKACKLKIVSQENDINKGAVFENAVAQELHAQSYALYYYNSKKQGEIDFLIEREGRVLPIEVKSGKAYDRHSALDHMMEARGDHFTEAFVFADTNIKNEGKITYFPIYMAMFLGEETLEFKDISIDNYKFK